MVLIVLLLVAVVSLVLGLALANAIWLIVSLVASALAAVVLYLVVRGQRTRKAGSTAAEPALADASVASRSAAELAEAELAMAGAGTRSGSGSSGYGGKEQAVTLNKPAGVGGPSSNGVNGTRVYANGTSAATLDQVWVADGFPEFHTSSCRELTGRTAEPIPFGQAMQDGFTPCLTCQPTQTAQVWVADGYPDFHLERCAELVGLDNEAVPHQQAMKDGFQPCSVCRPDDALSAPAAADSFAVDDSAAAAESIAVGEAVDAADAVTVVESVDVVESARAAEVAEVADEVGPVEAVHLVAESAGVAIAAAGAHGDPTVWVADGHPDYHLASCALLVGLSGEPIPLSQAAEDGFARCSQCGPPDAPAELAGARRPAEVWVVDGRPDYHAYGCSLLEQLDVEAVPYAQAVEDGFHACQRCPADSPDAPTAPDVWVIDGSPDYHLADCARIADVTGEQVPHGQAVEDGFAECTVCRPDARAGHREVVVVDGQPDYHRADCAALAGLSSEPISRTQAVEDGFTPCADCDPDIVAPPADTVPDAAVVEPELEAEVAEPVVEPEVVEPEATVVEPEPEVVEPESVELPAAVVEAEPESVVGEPIVEAEPQAAVVEAEPGPQVAEPEVVEPEPEAAVVEPIVEQPQPEPETAAVAPPDDDAADASTQQQVLVLNGRPRYHLDDCIIIKGQPAETISIDQAVADGFQPCSLCAR